MPEHLAPAWPCWRLVLEQRVSLDGLDNVCLDDVLDANDALDLWYDAQERASKAASR